MSVRARKMGLLSVAAALLAFGAFEPTAEACGCLSPPIPDPVNDDSFAVNQQAEQIIFEVEPGFVTAHVLIRYAGDADKFAWIVPVPNAPELALSESFAFGLLDDATQPAVSISEPSLCPSPEYACEYHPPPRNCPQQDPFPGGGAGGTGGGGGGSAGAAGGANAPPGGVEVINREQIGSYDTVTFGAGDASAAVAWLNAEGFIVNDTMTPFMQDYIDGGMLFVASKLIPGADVDQIRPLKMKYAGTSPMVPLKLTAVAAEPHLTVTTYIFGDEAFVPKDHPLLGIDPGWLSRGADDRINYPMVIARAADDAGGDGFVMEFHGAPPEPSFDDGSGCCGGGDFDSCFIANDGLCQCPGDAFDADDCAEEEDLLNGIELVRDLAQKHGKLTRLTTRISAEEMTFDPAFEPGAAMVTGRLTLNGTRKQMRFCEGDIIDDAFYASIEAVQACASVYCGQGECVVTGQGPACRCDAGFVARAFRDLDGEQSVTCVPDTHTVDYAAAGITLPDACAELSCGANGSCVDVGGFPTCLCAAGFAATTVGDAPLPTCAAVERVSGSSGARDFSEALEDVRACAPPPPQCGQWGWLVENPNKTRQGVVCPSSVPSNPSAFTPPPAPTCEDYYGGSGGSGPFDPKDPNDPSVGAGTGGTTSSGTADDAQPGGGGGCACEVASTGSAWGALSVLGLLGAIFARPPSEPGPARLVPAHSGGFGVEGCFGALIPAVGFFGGGSDGGEAELAELGHRAQEVKHDAHLAPRLVVHAAHGGDVEHVSGHEPLILRLDEVVGGDVAARLPAPGDVEAAVRVVVAVVDELHRHDRVGGPRHAQIDLDGVPFPSASGLDGHEVHRDAADHPPLGEHLADREGVVLDLPAIGALSGKAAAQVDAAVGSPQDLIVGAHRLEVTPRVDAQLDARRALAASLDVGLHDAAHAAHLLFEVGPGFGGAGEPQMMLEALEDAIDAPVVGALLRAHSLEPRAQGKDGVAFAAEALVELHDHPLGFRVLFPERRDGFGDVAFLVEVLGAGRHGHARLPEDLPRAALGAQRQVVGVDAVQRDAEAYGQATFSLAHREDREMRALRVDALADALDEPRALEDLIGQRAGARVVAREDRQPALGVRGRDAADEREEVVDDRRLQRLGRHVDESRAGSSQQTEREQHPLFVGVDARDRRELETVEGERGHDDDVALSTVRVSQLEPPVHELLLHQLESADLLAP